MSMIIKGLKHPVKAYLAAAGKRFVSALPFGVSLISLMIAYASLQISNQSMKISESTQLQQNEALSINCSLANSDVHFFNTDDFERTMSKGYVPSLKLPIFMSAYWNVSISNTSTQPLSLASLLVVQSPSRVSKISVPLNVATYDDFFSAPSTIINFPHLLTAGDTLSGYVEGSVLLRGTDANIKEFIKAHNNEDIYQAQLKAGRSIFNDDIIIDKSNKFLAFAHPEELQKQMRLQPPFSYGPWINLQVTTMRRKTFVTACPFFDVAASTLPTDFGQFDK